MEIQTIVATEPKKFDELINKFISELDGKILGQSYYCASVAIPTKKIPGIIQGVQAEIIIQCTFCCSIRYVTQKKLEKVN